MNYANPTLIGLRRIGQSLRILRPMVRFYRKLTNSKYEQAFDSIQVKAIVENIQKEFQQKSK